MRGANVGSKTAMFRAAQSAAAASSSGSYALQRGATLAITLIFNGARSHGRYFDGGFWGYKTENPRTCKRRGCEKSKSWEIFAVGKCQKLHFVFEEIRFRKRWI